MNTIKPLDSFFGVFREYPRQFRILIFATFIDHLGSALVFPFLTLYITQKFGVGMIEVGIIFALYSSANVVGNMLSGALCDRFGRKKMLIFGLIVSALTSLLMGVLDSIEWFFGAALLVGLFAEAGGPARRAMVADLLPVEKRAEGYGILRVVVNLCVTIGPAIGGFMAGYSYLLLFIGDAVLSSITALIVVVAIRETMPEADAHEPEQTIAQTLNGYRQVLLDTKYILFIGACMLQAVVAIQMNTTLAVYLRDIHNIPPQGFGYIMSLNAGMVVLFQFSVTRWIAEYQPMLLMVTSSVLFAVGFGLYGFVSHYALFMGAMAIITIGEMVGVPTSQALAARFAPEDMRGRYMAIFGFVWVIPAAIGPLLAGFIMDNVAPHWVWYNALLLGLAAAALFALMHRREARVGELAVE